MKKFILLLFYAVTISVSLSACSFESDEERDQRLIKEEIEKRRR